MHRMPLFSYLQTATQVVLAQFIFCIGLCVIPQLLSAATLDVRVMDRSGAPIRDVVVTITPSVAESRSNAAPAANAPRGMIMDQLNMMFVPQVLLVPVGAAVNFPNSDSVSHQVYSFSRTKPFQLPLYKGKTYPPVVFDKPGLVVLGCNIHDAMVGYIYVTDARWYGQTDAQGQLRVSGVDAGKMSVTIWSPLIADGKDNLSRGVDVAVDQQSVSFKMIKPLRSSPEPKPRRADWDY